MCVFALEKSTERLKKTHKKLGVTGNQTLIFADLACEQAHVGVQQARMEHRRARRSREREIERRSRETRKCTFLAPLHHTPPCLIDLPFVARAHDSKVSLFTGYSLLRE